jgi:hypothetical protein
MPLPQQENLRVNSKDSESPLVSAIRFVPFTDDWIPAVQDFNRRLVAGGLAQELAYPESPALEFPNDPGSPIRQEPFLAVQDSTVRGGYYFTHERYRVADAETDVANYRHPISEVVIDKRFKGLASRLLEHAREQQPFLYAIGFGSDSNPNLKRLVKEGWSFCKVPFLFQIRNASRCLSQIAAFRSTPLRGMLAKVAVYTGAGAVAIHGMQAMRKRAKVPGIRAEIVDQFSDWADAIWEAGKHQFRLAAVRDGRTLQLRYGASDRGFIRLKVSEGEKPVGWAVLLTKQMHGNKYFGDLCVGTLVDCFAMPGYELAVAQRATEELAGKVDLIVSNQSSTVWNDALRGCGYQSGPSNYIYAASAELVQNVGALDAQQHTYHLTRGDGAGISRL